MLEQTLETIIETLEYEDYFVEHNDDTIWAKKDGCLESLKITFEITED